MNNLVIISIRNRIRKKTMALVLFSFFHNYCHEYWRNIIICLFLYIFWIINGKHKLIDKNMDQSVDTYKSCIKCYLEKFLKFFFLNSYSSSPSSSTSSSSSSTWNDSLFLLTSVRGRFLSFVSDVVSLVDDDDVWLILDLNTMRWLKSAGFSHSSVISKAWPTITDWSF